MKLWIVSDLHTDHSPWQPAVPDHDVMIIAGDLSDGAVNAHAELVRIRRLIDRRTIIFVPGNHDLAGEQLDAFPAFDRFGAGGIQILSSGQSVVIGDVRFVGATLWTDWQLGDREYQSQSWAASYMREYQTVQRPGGGPLWPIHTSDAHELQLAAIRGILAMRHEGPTVVVTHHAPSPRSLRPGEERGVEAAAYASDLERTMDEYGPDLWVHGHTHHAVDYCIGHTRVASNPRGYVRDGWSEQTGWDEGMVIDV